MPVGRTAKKKTQQNKALTPVTAAATQSVHDVTVRDCLMWPDDDKTRQTTVGQEDVVYVSLRQQQQQQQQGPESSVSQVRPPAPPPEDYGGVSDALRGWPRHMVDSEQVIDKTDDDTQEVTCKQTQTKTKTGQAAKTQKTKSKSNATQDKDEDIHVADLISQRFLHEYMEQRETEMERDKKKKEAREQAAREGRRAAKDRTDIKANKAAQLRAIALADRVETSPHDLWKMDKFTRAARPHVSTFRNGPGGPSGASSKGAGGAGDGRRNMRVGGRVGGGHAGGGGYARNTGGRLSGRSSSGMSYDDEDFGDLVGACTCPEKLPYYEGYDMYDTYDACSDGRPMTDDAADCSYSYMDTTSPIDLPTGL